VFLCWICFCVGSPVVRPSARIDHHVSASALTFDEDEEDALERAKINELLQAELANNISQLEQWEKLRAIARSSPPSTPLRGSLSTEAASPEQEPAPAAAPEPVVKCGAGSPIRYQMGNLVVPPVQAQTPTRDQRSQPAPATRPRAASSPQNSSPNRRVSDGQAAPSMLATLFVTKAKAKVSPNTPTPPAVPFCKQQQPALGDSLGVRRSSPGEKTKRQLDAESPPVAQAVVPTAGQGNSPHNRTRASSSPQSSWSAATKGKIRDSGQAASVLSGLAW
jgi:hypothetical protein